MLGLENSFWLSYDDGAHWRKPALGLPPVAMYDIRVQPRWNDLILATHGRAAWILDDLTPLQQLPQAEAAGAMLFAPRTAYQFSTHANDEGLYTRYAGKNPPAGAIDRVLPSQARREGARDRDPRRERARRAAPARHACA